MIRIIILVLLFFFSNSYTCTIQIVNNTYPPTSINGEWVESKKPVKGLPNINYAKLIKNHSIVFSGVVELAYTENKEISEYIFADEIWKGHVLESFDINSYNANIKVIDGYCGHRLIDGHRYIFFAEIGTRKTPIRISKIVHDNKEVRKYLKDPAKSWHKGEIVKY
jgi:hypothetical protein